MFEGIFGFVCAGFSKKVHISTLLYPSTFESKNPILEAFLLIKTPKTCKKKKKRFWPKNVKLSQKIHF